MSKVDTKMATNEMSIFSEKPWYLKEVILATSSKDKSTIVPPSLREKARGGDQAMSDLEADKEKYPADDIRELEEKKDINGLIQLVKAGKSKYLKYAIGVLGKLKAEKAADLLLDLATKSELVSIRSAAILALGEIGGEEVVDPIISLMVKDKSVRSEAIEAIGEIKNQKAVGPLAVFLKDKDEEEYIREKAISSLIKIGDIAAVEALIRVLEDESPNIVEKASMAIKELGKMASKPLVNTLGSGNIQLRRKIVGLLGEIGDGEATGALLGILKNQNEDNELRGDAAEALGRIGDYTATEVLIETVSEDEDYCVRCRSVMALGNLGEPKAGELLIKIVDNRDNPLRIRGLAAEALGKIGDRKAAEPLMSVLKDEREELWLRGNATWALGELQYGEAVPLIMKYFRECWKAGDTDGMGKGMEALDKLGAFNYDR
jgi:HEAT repeat protein